MIIAARKALYILLLFLLGALSSVALLPTRTSDAKYAVIDNVVYTNEQFISINMNLHDDGVGFTDESRMRFSNNGSTWSRAERFSSQKNNWDITLNIPEGEILEGERTIQARASDGLGNWTDRIISASLVYDISEPRITNIYPAENQFDTKVDDTISVYITDNLSGVDLQSIVFKVNGLEVVPTATVDGSYVLVEYQPPSDLPYDSQVRIQVSCKDNVGNLLEQPEYVFFVESEGSSLGTIFSENILPWGDSKEWRPLNKDSWKVSLEDENKVYELKEHIPTVSNLLFFEDFNRNIGSGRFKIIDNGNKRGPSNWYITQGVLVQDSNIFGWDAQRSGTFFYTVEGRDWKNYDFSVDLGSSDNDSIGVIFRHRDNKNFYQFSRNKQKRQQKLIKVVDGAVKTLFRVKGTGYVRNEVQHLRIRANGSYLAVYINGSLIGEAKDSDIASGGVGLYSWANSGSYFDNMIVQSLDQEDRISTYSIDDMTSIVDHVGENLSSVLGNEYSIYKNSSYKNFAMEYKARAFAGDTFAIFRYVDSENYYMVNFPVRNLNSRCSLYKVEDGKIIKIAHSSSDVRIEIEKRINYTVSAVGEDITVYVEGVEVLSAKDATFTEGKVGIGSFLRKATFDDFQVSIID